jgi:hypothetical protein
MRITTSDGERDVDAEGLAHAVREIHRARARIPGERSTSDPDPNEFLVVHGPRDDSFVQIRPWLLERGEDGRVFRGTLPPAVLELLRGFAEGRPGWDAGVEWTDVESLPRVDPAGRKATWIAAGMLVPILAWAAVQVFRAIAGKG